MTKKYCKFFHFLINRKMSTAQLAKKAQVSSIIITRLKRDEYISVESIEKLCCAFDCGTDDILEFVK